MKKKIKLRQSANSQSAWAKIKLLVDAAGLAKSMRHQKDEIKYLNDTSKQVKDNNKRRGSATQTSAYFQDFDQLLGTREDISSKNITQVSVEEGPLLSDWGKIEPPENNFDSDTFSSSQHNMENKSGNIASSGTGRNRKISRYLDKLCEENVACFMKKN